MAMLRNDYGELESCDVHFLYEEERWDGRKIEDLENSHLVNIGLMLEAKAEKNKLSFELFTLDHMNDKLMRPIMDVTEVAKLNALEWTRNTPMYKAIMKELERRGLSEYFKVVSERREKENGEKNN